MAGQSPREVTQLLQAWGSGDQKALQALVPLVCGELHRLAHPYMLRACIEHTLQTTALVNETCLKLIDSARVRWQDRTHLCHFGLPDAPHPGGFCPHARQPEAGLKRLQGELDESRVALPGRNMDLIALDSSLNSLAVIDPRQAKVVELRFFSGPGERRCWESRLGRQSGNGRWQICGCCEK